MMTKIIQIDDSLRLVPYFLADHQDAALAWYQEFIWEFTTHQM